MSSTFARKLTMKNAWKKWLDLWLNKMNRSVWLWNFFWRWGSYLARYFAKNQILKGNYYILWIQWISLSESAKLIWLAKLTFYGKNHPNLSKKRFSIISNSSWELLLIGWIFETLFFVKSCPIFVSTSLIVHIHKIQWFPLSVLIFGPKFHWFWTTFEAIL